MKAQNHQTYSTTFPHQHVVSVIEWHVKAPTETLDLYSMWPSDSLRLNPLHLSIYSYLLKTLVKCIKN